MSEHLELQRGASRGERATDVPSQGTSEAARQSKLANSTLGDALATNWLFERGRFYMEYDAAIAQRTFAALGTRGHEPIDPSGLVSIGQAFLSHWHQAFGPFAKACHRSPRLRRWLAAPVLSDITFLDSDELEVIVHGLPGIWLDHGSLVDLGSSERAWLQRISLPLPAPLEGGPGTDLVTAYQLNRLRVRPVLVSHGRALLAMPQRLETDLTDLLDREWSADYGEDYFYLRGRVVEEVAFSTLMRLPGAIGISAAEYSSMNTGSVGETDGIVIWERTAIVIEAKGGFLTQDARRGNHTSALANVRDTVGAAFFQASRFLRLLHAEGQVELKGADGRRLVVRRADVDRAHVVIPTADDFGSIGVAVTDLTDARILPEGATPLVVACQDLCMMFDLLPDPLDIGAYLLFREEVLANRTPRIRVADEHELLAAYVIGTDVVGRAARISRENADPDMVLIADPNLQHHLDNWITERRRHRDTVPPIRHEPRIIRAAHDMAASGNTADALALLRCGYEEAHEALKRLPVKPPSRPSFIPSPDISLVVSKTPLHPVYQRRTMRQSRTRPGRYVWMVRWPLASEPATIYAAHANPAPSHPEQLLKTVDGRELDRWYSAFAARRRKRRRGRFEYDEELVITLVNEGLPDALSRGVCRAGLVDQVRSTHRGDISLGQAASFWLNEVASLAKARSLRPADLQLDPRQVATLIKAKAAKRMSADQVSRALSAVVDGGMNVDDVISSFPNPVEISETGLRQLVIDILRAEEELRERAASGEGRATHALAGLVMRGAPWPKPRMPAVLAEIAAQARSRDW